MNDSQGPLIPHPDRLPLVVLSLGAGVQSTTLALMAAAGELEPPDCAIFADTGWEPQEVYDHLERLVEALPFPVHRVTAGNLREDILQASSTGRRVASPPWFTENGGRLPRQCTADYKTAPIARKQRELLGVGPKSRLAPGSVEVWLGISTDEAIRMKPSPRAWQRNRWPLVERGMSRSNCVAWLERAGWNAPKSACIGCPYHSDARWREMRASSYNEWMDAVEVDHAIRFSGKRDAWYMHRSLSALDRVDLSTPEEHGQGVFGLWAEECEGVCGV